MKRKILSTLFALVLALSLSLVTAVPVSAAEGTIELDAEWYKTTDTVTVTIVDADLDVLQSETQDEGTETPDSTRTTFTFDHTNIEFAVVSKPYDMRNDQYLVQSVNDALGQITLQAAPPALAELMAAIAIAVDLSLDVQPTESTELKLVMSVVANANDEVVITGIVAGSADSETIIFGAGETEKTTTKIFDSVDANGIDAAGYTAGGTITINADNLVFADYTYYGVETFEGSVISSVDAVGVTPAMTETGPHTGIFEGTLILAVATNDGVSPPQLKVADGGTITAVYDDADPVATVTDSANVDDTDPSLISQSPAAGAKINGTTPVVSVAVLDFESGVLGDPALVMEITGPGAVSPVQTVIPHGYHLEYHVGTGEALSAGTITVTITGEDIVGNSISPNTWTFDIDLSAPTMDSAATATTTTIAVTFSEELDDATVAASDFLVGGLVTPTEVAVVAAVVTLTVPEMPTDATPTVELVGAVSDIAGNELTEDDVTATDGVGPTVAIAVSPDPCGAGDATFDLTFSETMKTSVAPTVEFTDTAGPNTVTGGDWTGTTTWQGTFGIDGLGAQEFASVVTVTLGEDLATNVMAEATGSFAIDTLVDTPTFSPVTGADVYTASPVVRITFSEVVTITAALFGGENVLADLVTSDNMTFKLATEDLTTGSYTISVEAEDALGNTGGPFEATFAVAVALSYDIDLYAGWNLISLPLVPDDLLIDAVLSGISVPGTVSKVWAYDAQTTDWSYYVPDPGIGELGVMRDGVGYWLEMSADATLTIDGSVLPEPPSPPQSYDVYAGWNLIGCTTQETTIDTTDYLDSVDTFYTHVWGYDVSTGYFVVYSAATEVNMSPGMGYWIWMTADGVIVPAL